MKIFCDIDDTVLKSSKRIIEMLNEKYGLNKSEKDLKDWNYTSVYNQLTDGDVLSLFEDDTFFDKVQIFEESVFVLKGHDVYFCTKGTDENLRKKEKKIKEIFKIKYSFIGLGFDDGFDKSKVDMFNAIQIDDRYDSLEKTNASIKILFKNYNNFEWQKVPDGINNIYVVNTWKEILQIIDFIGRNFNEPCFYWEEWFGENRNM